MMLFAIGIRAQSISHIETTKSWYYIYDQDGKKIKTISTSQGELKGYSSTFYIIKQGTAFYITYDVKGKRLHTWGASSVGEILGVAGDTFTSKQGAWISTWSKDGKKMRKEPQLDRQLVMNKQVKMKRQQLAELKERLEKMI
jgi:hypothetical protein